MAVLNGTTVADLLNGAEAVALDEGDDTLEGGLDRNDADWSGAGISENLQLWDVAGVKQADIAGDGATGGSAAAAAEPEIPDGRDMQVGASLVARDVWDGPGGYGPGGRPYPADWDPSGQIKIDLTPGDVIRDDDIAGDGFEGGSGGDDPVYAEYDASYYAYSGDGNYGGDDYASYGEEYYGYYTGYTGYHTYSVGDVNGDGFDDYLVEGYGSSYMMYGDAATDVAYGGDGYDYAGDGDVAYTGDYADAGGDVDGDGFADTIYTGYYAYDYAYAGGDVDGDGFEDDAYADAGEDVLDWTDAGEIVVYTEDGEFTFAVGDGVPVIPVESIPDGLYLPAVMADAVPDDIVTFDV